MDDVWFGSNLTRRDWEAVVEALSLRISGPPPLIAIADRGSELVLASRTLFDLFSVGDAKALSSRLIGGSDPGARRLATLCTQLPIGGAPRLERLRFFIGPVSQVVTFLCRRILGLDQQPLFVAAALGLRPANIMTDPRRGVAGGTGPRLIDKASSASDPEQETQSLGPDLRATPAGAPNVQAIQATLRQRWPTNSSIRFLWQTDADLVCTGLTPPLGEVVGAPNADLVGHNLLDLAPRLDPTGRLARVLADKVTWSGRDVAWPISDTPATVEVGLGAIPAWDREGVFAGYRGYGVIRLGRVLAGHVARLLDPSSKVSIPAHDNVVAFPGALKPLSPEDQNAFDALGAELRDKAGIEGRAAEPTAAAMPFVPPPDPALEQGPAATPAAPSVSGNSAPPDSDGAVTGAPVEPSPHNRAEDVARNGLAVLDRLSLALLVSRDNVPIFANRHLLDVTGFADEDALHGAGGMAHLFGGMAGNASGSETIGVRTRDGTVIPATARMKRIEWDGLPATLLMLQPSGDFGTKDDVDASVPAPDNVPPQAAAAPKEATARPLRDDEELRELRAILETAADGVAVIDAECNVVSLNRSGEALFGCDRGEVVGKPFLALFAPDNQGLATEYFEGLKSSATKSLLNDGREFLVKTHQGGTISVFMTLGRLGDACTDAEKAAPRFCAMFRDLTPWKKVEHELETARQEAERASALKTDFLAKVSHEVRTPLNAILGFAEVISQERFGPVGSDRYKEYLRDIHASGTHVMSLVNDLLDLSKIEAGKIQLTQAQLDTNKIVSECVALMQPQANRDRIIMRLSLAPDLAHIQADERSLRQIVLNILSNAVKFNDPGGQVIVSTAATESGCVVIRVRDTGPGMSETGIVTALEPFRRLETANKSAAGGTGLGLPLTKALVEANEATFTIRSKVDQGTLVEVSFPPARVLAGGRNA